MLETPGWISLRVLSLIEVLQVQNLDELIELSSMGPDPFDQSPSVFWVNK